MKSNNSFIKKKKAEERVKKKNEKIKNRLEKKKEPKKSFESMIAYVDKNGNITSEPPTESEPDIKEDNG